MTESKSLFDVTAQELAQRVLDRWMPHELHGYEQMGQDGKDARDALTELVRRAEGAPKGEMTVQHLFDEAEKWGAAKMAMVFRDDADVPVRAVIVVDGQPESGEIVDAVEAVQAKWNAEADA